MSNEPEQTRRRIALDVQYVAIIAVVCLFAGMLLGGSIGQRNAALHASTCDHSDQAAAEFDDETATAAVLKHIESETDHRTLVEMGNHAYDRQRPDIAIPAYEKALTYQPNDSNVLTDLAAMYVLINRPGHAAELARRAASIDENHPQSRYWLGVALAEVGDKDGARTAFREAESLAPGTQIAVEAHRQLHLLDD